MPSNPEQSPEHCVYFFDSEEQVVQAARGSLCSEYPSWQIRATSNPAEASRWLTQARPTALVTTLSSGHRLAAQARSLYDDLPLLLVGESNHGVVGFDGGSVEFVRPNAAPVELARALRRVIRDQRGASAPRFVNSTQLSELVAALIGARYQGTLRVEDVETGLRGMVSIRSRRVTHACVGDTVGTAAFEQMTGWTRRGIDWSNELCERITMSLNIDELEANAA